MPRTLKFALLLACALWLLAPLFAQYNNYNGVYVPVPSIYAPQIQLGSAYQPATITIPPEAVEISPTPAPPNASNAPPASTELLSSRHFDYIVSPLDMVTPGSMEDTSISLGEYARQLRAEKKQQQSFPPTEPNAIAAPPNRWK